KRMGPIVHSSQRSYATYSSNCGRSTGANHHFFTHNDLLVRIHREIDGLTQTGPGGIFHPFRPDVKTALPLDTQWIGDFPQAPNSFAFVVARIEYFVLA